MALGGRSKMKRAWPPRGLAACFSSTSEAAALHQVDDERHRLELERAGTCPAGRPSSQRLAVRLLGRRHGGLQGGERERPELLQAQPAELLGEPLGVGLDLGHLRHRRRCSSLVPRSARGPSRTRRRGRRTPAGTSSRRCWSPCSRICPLMNASWALSAPVATATAVSHDCSMRTCSGSAGPGGEVDRAVADLQVVGHVALRAVGDDLGDADLVLGGELARATRWPRRAPRRRRASRG